MSVKFLDIADFVNLVPPLLEEQVLSESNGIELVMPSAARKPKLQNISIEDWCLANTCIMDEMYSSGRLNSHSIRNYMAHTIKICELFRVYDTRIYIRVYGLVTFRMIGSTDTSKHAPISMGHRHPASIECTPFEKTRPSVCSDWASSATCPF